MSSPDAARPTAKRNLLVTVAGAVVLISALAAAGYVWYESGGKPTKAAKVSSDKPVKAPSAKKTEYLGLAYPASSGTLPKSISIKYDKSKDRTKLILHLGGLKLDAGSGGASDVHVDLQSEYVGRTRPADHAETSVKGTVTLYTTSPGVLASASPPGTFVVDGTTLDTRDEKSGRSGYTSTKAGSGYMEELVFKLDVKDLITLAMAKNVSGKFGLVSFTLTPEQRADLREFGARLNPTPQ